MYFITLVFVIVFVTFNCIKCDCDENTGPVGSFECVLLDHYTQYQWAYCKTDKYIQIKSKGRHSCENHSATYCYYQCNIEVNEDGASGPVLPNCQCNSSDVISTPIPLPGSCTSPDGTDCNWYTDCLEKRYPCKQSGELSYATDYALKYCSLYTDHYQAFSDTGKRWVDAVRKCLQVQLVSLLNPNVKVTCQGIQDKALASHEGCYLNPGDNAPSVCDIGVLDSAKVFWTIKGFFVETPTVLPMLTSSLNISLQCKRQWVNTLTMKIVSKWKKSFHGIDKRSLDKSSLNEYDRVFQVSDIFSSQMNWKQKGILWFAYPEGDLYQSKDTQYRFLSIVLMLAPQSEYDLNAEPTTVSVNITEAMSDFEYSLENGKISIPSDNGLQITNVSLCNDMSCSSTDSDFEIKFAEAKSSGNSKPGNTSNLTIILIACGSVFGMVLLVSAIVALLKFRKRNGYKLF